MKRKKLFILIFLAIVLASGAFATSGGLREKEIKEAEPLVKSSISEIESDFSISVEVTPYKIKVGDVQTTTVKIKDSAGIEKVSAKIPFEGGYDEIFLKLISGDEKDGIWEGKWTAHNTKVKEYTTKITAVNKDREIRTTEATWWDDIETVWYDQNWKQRKKITIDPITPEINYQVKVELTTAIMDDPYANVKADGDDIRFCEADGTVLDYWIESYNAAGTSTIWVEVATNNTDTIYMYYGNLGVGAESNGTNTFDLFEMFDSDLGWTVTNSDWSYDVINKWYHDTGDDSDNVISDYSTDDCSIVAKFRIDSGVYAGIGIAAREQADHWYYGLLYRGNLAGNVIGSLSLYRQQAGTGNIVGIDGVALTGFSYDTWYWMRFDLYGNNLVGYTSTDGHTWTERISTTDANYATGKIGFANWDDRTTGNADEIRVRKYTSPEPTAAVGNEEKRPHASGISPSGGGAMMF